MPLAAALLELRQRELRMDWLQIVDRMVVAKVSLMLVEAGLELVAVVVVKTAVG